MELLSAATTSDLIANVQSAVGTTAGSLWAIAAVAVAIPLAFYVLHAVIGLFPKSRSRRS